MYVTWPFGFALLNTVVREIKKKKKKKKTGQNNRYSERKVTSRSDLFISIS